jgi:tape measure domain-containing protein
MAVNIRVNADTSQARRDLNKLETSIVNIDKRTKTVSKNLTRLAVGISTAFGSAVAVRSINQATDSLTSLQNRIALVTGRTEALSNSLDELYAIARGAGGSIDGAVETFNRFGLALSNAGANVEDILRATESVQRSIAISGGSAQSASAAIFQLGQGLASGTLRGQELNSVLEQAPRLAQAISDSLGVGIGDLRGIAEQGGLTTDIVFGALLDQAETLNEEFQILERTSSQAFVVFRDTLNRLTGDISRTVGFTNLFTSTFDFLTNEIVNNSDVIEVALYSALSNISSTFRDLRLVGQELYLLFEQISGIVLSSFLPSFTSSEGFVSKLAKGFLSLNRQILRARLYIAELFNETQTLSTAFKIFRSESLLEVADVLYDLSLAIDEFGLKDTILYELAATFVDLENTIISFYNTLRLNDSFDDLIVAAYFMKRDVTNYIEGLVDDANNSFENIKSNISNIFAGISSTVTRYLSPVVDFITSALDVIERKFFWVYDQVIGNSWWTDTMEMTYFYAVEYLSKTEEYVSDFTENVVDKFRTLYRQINTFVNNLSLESIQDTALEFSVDLSSRAQAFFENPLENVNNALDSVLENFAKPLAALFSDIYKELSGLYPAITSILTLAFGASFIGLISSSFSKGLLFVARGGLIAVIASTFISNFGSEFFSSGIISEFSKAVGSAFGSIIGAVLSNIPEITRALIQVAVGFAQGLAEGISGIPGLILKGLVGSGSLTNGLTSFVDSIFGTIIGSISLALTAYAFNFAGFRGLTNNLIKARQKAFDKAAENGNAPSISFLESVLIGRDGGRRVVAKYAGIFLGLNAVLGTVIEDPVLRDVIAAGGVVASAIFSQNSNAVIQAGFNAITQIRTQIISLFATLQGQSLSQIATNLLTAVSSVATSISTMATTAYAQFAGMVAAARASAVGIFASFSTAFNGITPVITAALSRARALITAFAASARAKFLGISLAIALAFSASSANASVGEVEASTDSLIAKLERFIVSPIGMLGLVLVGNLGFTKLLAGISAVRAAVVSTIAAGAIGNTARAGLLSLAIFGEGSILAGIGAVLAGIGKAILAFIGSWTAIIIAAVAVFGLIGIAVFGEGDSFGEKLGNAYDAVRKFFGFSSREASRLRSNIADAIGEIREIDDIEINLIGTLQGVNLEGADPERAERAIFLANRTNSILEEANRAFEEDGRISSAQRRRIERAVLLTRDAIEDLDTTEDGAGNVRTQAGLLTPLLSSVLSGGVGDFRDAVANQNRRLTRNAFSALEEIQTAVDQGLDVQFLLDDFLTDFGSQLSGTQYGAAFIDLITAISENASQDLEIAPDTLSSISTDLLDIEQQIGQGGTALRDAFTAAAEEIRTGTEQATVDRRIVIRENEEEAFRNALADIDSIFGNEYDFGQFDDSFITRLGVNDLRAVTDYLIEQVESITEELEGLDAQGRGSEARVAIIESLQTGLDNYLDDWLTTAGLQDPVENEVASRLDVLNDRLSEIGVQTLDLLPSGDTLFNDLSGVAQSQYTIIDDIVGRIESARASLTDGTDRTNAEINQIITNIARLSNELELTIATQNAQTRATVDRIGAIQAALSQVDDPVDLDTVLAFSPSRINEILTLSASIDVLTLSLTKLAAAGTGDAGIQRALQVGIDNARARLDELLGGGGVPATGGGGGGGETQTAIEQLTSSLSELGFTLDTLDIAGFNLETLNSLSSAAESYLEAQEAVTESAFEEVEARRQALETLNQSREQVANILAESTFGGLRAAFEGLGSSLDVSTLLSFNEGTIQSALENALRIVEIESQINSLTVDQIDLARELNAELMMRRSLEENLYQNAINNTEGVRESFKSNISDVLKGAKTLQEAFEGILDDISSRIIDTVVDSFVDAFFEASGLNDLFTNLFAGLFNTGQSVGSRLGESIGNSMTSGLENSLGDGGGFLSGITEFFGSLIQGIGDFIGGLFGGGGGGGFFSFFSSFGTGFLGLNEGGLVKPMGTSRTDIDSVPAMLTPGELVVPADKVDSLLSGQGIGGGGQTTVVNLSITGDISRQTKAEVMRMIPQIASGVNATNRENNYRAR